MKLIDYDEQHWPAPCGQQMRPVCVGQNANFSQSSQQTNSKKNWKIVMVEITLVTSENVWHTGIIDCSH